MKTVVISQPMLFPWPGIFEQLLAADVWVHYDDVALSKSGFMRRVEIKTARGCEWLTVPLAGYHRGQRICDVQIASDGWMQRHEQSLARAYAGAPHLADMRAVVERVYASPHASLAELTIHSMEKIVDYFGLRAGKEFVRSSELGVDGAGSERILRIVKALGGDRYVTGHGGRNYLDHERFDAHGVRVEYADYALVPYAQQHGPFTPHVSALDLIANEGREGARVLVGRTLPWRTFLEQATTDTAS